MWDFPEIDLPIIQAVSADMINIPTVSGAAGHNLSMQQNGVLSILGFSRGSDSVTVSVNTPSPLTNEIDILSVYKDMANDDLVCVDRDEYGRMCRHQDTSGVGPQVLAHRGDILCESIAGLERSF